MPGILLRTVIVMLGLYLASSLIAGVHIDGLLSFFIAALLLSLVNAVVRPLLFILTLPLTIVTLGLFILVLNASMFALVAVLLHNFHVDSFWAALFGALIVSITSTVVSWYIGPDGRYEVFAVRKR